MKMACSAPLAVSYSAACPCTSGVAARSRVNGGGCRWPAARLSGMALARGMDKPGLNLVPHAEATQSAAGAVVDAAVDHSSDPNELFWFDLLEYESTNGPVCLASFVPSYDPSLLHERKPPPAKVEPVPVLEAAVAEQPKATFPRPQSPFARYPDLKPPSSPTPSAPPKGPAPASVVAKTKVAAPAARLYIPPTPQSPYTGFPDLKPPTSPTPSPPSQ